jgi:ketosteroid isomerase-like protein
MESTHPNLQLIHNFFQAYAANNLDAIHEILSPDIQWVIPGRHPFSGVKHGAREVLEYFKQLGAFGFQAQPMVMGVNDRYVIDCHLNWSNLPGDNNLRNMSCLLWEIEEGKIKRVYNFPQDQRVVDAFFTTHGM